MKPTSFLHERFYEATTEDGRRMDGGYSLLHRLLNREKGLSPAINCTSNWKPDRYCEE